MSVELTRRLEHHRLVRPVSDNKFSKPQSDRFLGYTVLATVPVQNSA